MCNWEGVEFVWKDGTSECGAGGWIFGARVICVVDLEQGRKKTPG